MRNGQALLCKGIRLAIGETEGLYGTKRLFLWFIEISIQPAAVCGDGDHLPGDEFSRSHQGGLDGIFNAAAAGNLHAHHGDRFDVVLGDDLRQFVGKVGS